MQEVKSLEGVRVVESHMCMFGLRVHRELNKKPILIMTTCLDIATEVHRLYDYSYFHEPLEGRKNQESPEVHQGLLRSRTQRS